jgi:uncharacterized membrane protein YgcG
MRVNDFAGVLHPSYSADLDRRLARFDKSTGCAIYIVLIASDYDQSLTAIARDIFKLNQLEKTWSARTLLLLIDTRKGAVSIATSQNLHRSFSGSQVENKIQNMLQRRAKNPNITVDKIVERAVHDVLVLINDWFYMLEPPTGRSSIDALLTRSSKAEVILFPLAPFLALMTGIILMAFTSAGGLPWATRLFVSGCLGCLVAVATAFLLRQSGGILPGILYYSAVMGFFVSAAIGALKPLWFNDKFTGRKPGEPGPLYFRWG